MRAALRLLRPAANQTNSPVWQDPVYGYYEQHGKMTFKPGEEYGISEAEKKAVLHRYRIKEILKKEYLRREYDPHHYNYKHSVVVRLCICEVSFYKLSCADVSGDVSMVRYGSHTRGDVPLHTSLYVPDSSSRRHHIHLHHQGALSDKGNCLLVLCILRLICACVQSDSDRECFTGERLWWDRQTERKLFIGGHGEYHASSTYV